MVGRVQEVVGVLVLASIVTGAGASAALDVDAPTAVTPNAAATAAYCKMSRGEAAAAAHLMQWPSLFGQVGLVNGGDSLTGDGGSGFGTTFRVTAGLRYDFVGLYQGLLTRWRADAQCERYTSQALLRTALEGGSQLGRRASVGALSLSLSALLTEARAHLASQQKRFDEGHLALDELTSLQLKVEALNSRLANAESEREQLALRPTLPEEVQAQGGLQTLLRDYNKASDEIADLEGTLRHARAWDVGVRGGYDQTFGNDRVIPAFALVSLTYNTGGLFLFGANDDAKVGAKRFRETDTREVQARTQHLVLELRQRVLSLSKRRLSQDALAGDLQERLLSLQNLSGARVATFREYLWFDAARLHAERVAAHAEQQALLAFLGDAAPPALAYAVLPALTVAPSEVRRRPLAGMHGLKPLMPADLDVTSGSLSPASAGREAEGWFSITDDTVRAVRTAHSISDREVALQFVYRGHTETTRALGSGKIREQVGLKLRAANGCNLLYVMWRLSPEPGVVVQQKRNPGKTLHIQCTNNGYETIPATTVAPPPTVAVGQMHALTAKLKGEDLVVEIDGAEVWKGPVGALTFDGPVGLRTDNAAIDGRLLAP